MSEATMEAPAKEVAAKPAGRRLGRNALGWLQAAPLTVVLLCFLVAPIGMIVIVSFWEATEYSIIPAFSFENYEFLFGSAVTYRVFLATFKYALVTWAATLAIGFTVAYCLAFHIRSRTVQIALFLLCTIPFWTSNIIRMISWIPFLGRNGIANQTLIDWGLLFYLAIASLVIPSILISLGVGLIFTQLGLRIHWASSGFGSQLTWTLPFGLLIMFAVFNRFDKSFEEAARDQGASAWQTIRHVVLPIIAPSLLGVVLFGFTLSYDEFARTLLTAGSYNTLPLEIFGMTTNVTTPVIYALGTLTTIFSFLIIGLFIFTVRAMARRRSRHGSDAGKGV